MLTPKHTVTCISDHPPFLLSPVFSLPRHPTPSSTYVSLQYNSNREQWRNPGMLLTHLSHNALKLRTRQIMFFFSFVYQYDSLIYLCYSVTVLMFCSYLLVSSCPKHFTAMFNSGFTCMWQTNQPVIQWQSMLQSVSQLLYEPISLLHWALSVTCSTVALCHRAEFPNACQNSDNGSYSAAACVSFKAGLPSRFYGHIKVGGAGVDEGGQVWLFFKTRLWVDVWKILNKQRI